MIHYANSLSDITAIYREKVSKLTEKRLRLVINEMEDDLTDGNWFSITVNVTDEALKNDLMGIIEGRLANPWRNLPVWLTLNQSAPEAVFQIRFQWCAVLQLGRDICATQ